MSQRKTHPLKELEIVLSSGHFHDANGDYGLLQECVVEALEILENYMHMLDFDDIGIPPKELEAAELQIARRESKHDRRAKGSRS